MGSPVTLLGALGDRWLFAQWDNGRIVLETPAPLTLGARLQMSVLLDTAEKQVSAASGAPDGGETP